MVCCLNEEYLFSGAGKTTICNALKARGIFSIDIDAVPDLCIFENVITGKRVRPVATNVDPGFF
jgi:hypothetical protein